ncbi:MAG TPA: DUF58 domain-containing protein [Verrucomicrobiae bacterium]|nr:DUF58 domain-containing protein [Verrucomicrobiae bacterium]
MNALWRILFGIYRAVSWLRYVAVRRFTRAGLVMLAALVVSAMIGVDMDNTVAYKAFAVIVCMLVSAVFFGWFFRGRFLASRQLPRFATVGSPFEYPVVILNHTRQNQAGLVLIEDMADPRPAFEEWKAIQLVEQRTARSLRFSNRQRSNPFKLSAVKEVAIPPLPPNGEVEVRVEVTPLRRGVLRYRGITVARADPLGLFRALAKCSLPDGALILPKRYALPPIALPGAMKYQEGGVALASNVGQSEEFVALRDYRWSDPLRHIHWRSWAKTGRPIVKEFADEFFVRHALVLDTFNDDPYSEAFEEAVSVAASFACTIQTQESLLDLLFVGAEAYCFTAGRGLAHTDQMLEILASVRVCTEKPFEILESLVLNHANNVSGCVCVLLAWDRPRRAFVEKLKGLGVPVMVVVILASAPVTPLEPGPMENEPDRFHTLVMGRIEEGLAGL